MIAKETIDYVIEFLVGREGAAHFVWHDSGWFEHPRMPELPLREFEGMPVLFWAGDKPDFVASAYFLMSRYEELLNPVRDEHGRFPGAASMPCKAGFIDRPIVDEYARYLRNNLVSHAESQSRREQRVRVCGGGTPLNSELQTSNSKLQTLNFKPKGIAKLYLTHDVDNPFETRYLKGRIRDVLSNLKRHHRFTLRPILDYLTGKSNPDCFDWILSFDDHVRRNGMVSQTSNFQLPTSNFQLPTSNFKLPTSNFKLQTSNIEVIYFILARKNGTSRDNWYLEDPRWPDLLARFRAHRVTLGLHTSYAAGGDMSTCHQDIQAFRQSVECLNERMSILRPCTPSSLHSSTSPLCASAPLRETTLNSEPSTLNSEPSTLNSEPSTLNSEPSTLNFEPLTLCSRHHFLRMTDPSDFRYLEEQGVTDDFSVGYADVAGFRVGTCRPYRWIDPRTGRLGRLVIHPMTIMECSLDSYMGLDERAAAAYALKLVSRVAEHGGECVLLWHNPSLCPTKGNWQRELYMNCVRRAAELMTGKGSDK